MSSDTSKMPWAEQEFGKARTQAILQAISSIFQRQPRTLLPLHAVRSRILVRGQHYLGLQSVRLDRIVGSEGVPWSSTATSCRELDIPRLAG
ncbi:MAG: hypothetical protein M3R24_35685 [Chloroflexota bacterium]|nr:hypothetical protein [Chloroflexota bacterium]